MIRYAMEWAHLSWLDVMTLAPHNTQLKSLISFARAKHLRLTFESHLNPRRLRRLTGRSGCRKIHDFFAVAHTVQ